MKIFDPEKFKALRKSKGLKLREVAEKTGYSIQQLSNYENGHSAPPADVLLNLLDVYQASNLDVQTNSSMAVNCA